MLSPRQPLAAAQDSADASGAEEAVSGPTPQPRPASAAPFATQRRNARDSSPGRAARASSARTAASAPPRGGGFMSALTRLHAPTSKPFALSRPGNTAAFSACTRDRVAGYAILTRRVGDTPAALGPGYLDTSAAYTATHAHSPLLVTPMQTQLARATPSAACSTPVTLGPGAYQGRRAASATHERPDAGLLAGPNGAVRAADFTRAPLRPGSAPVAGRTPQGYVPAEVIEQARQRYLTSVRSPPALAAAGAHAAKQPGSSAPGGLPVASHARFSYVYEVQDAERHQSKHASGRARCRPATVCGKAALNSDSINVAAAARTVLRASVQRPVHVVCLTPRAGRALSIDRPRPGSAQALSASFQRSPPQPDRLSLGQDADEQRGAAARGRYQQQKDRAWAKRRDSASASEVRVLLPPVIDSVKSCGARTYRAVRHVTRTAAQHPPSRARVLTLQR